ncbi:MAG: hypothetical protein R2879_05030 [Saprospiraceae bacterium]
MAPETVAPIAKAKKAAPKAEAPKNEPVKAAAPKAEAPAPAAEGEKDNLKKVEGIGPKIESLLNEEGILTFAQLAETDVEKIKEVLEAAGSRYKMHDPTTWPHQAGLAAAGNWDELEKLQDELKGGKSVD